MWMVGLTKPSIWITFYFKSSNTCGQVWWYLFYDLHEIFRMCWRDKMVKYCHQGSKIPWNLRRIHTSGPPEAVGGNRRLGSISVRRYETRLERLCRFLGRSYKENKFAVTPRVLWCCKWLPFLLLTTIGFKYFRNIMSTLQKMANVWYQLQAYICSF